jgi:flagellar motility protein MotE (MotC chaperone)
VTSWLAGLLGALAVGLPATIGAVLTYRAAARAQERSADIENRKVDQAAFETAQGIYERAISEAQRELGRVREQLDQERRESARMRGRVAALERVLATNGLPFPTNID